MNFDKVIMNPPYGDLHLPILKTIIEIMDLKTGAIVSLQPARWLEDPLYKYKNDSDFYKMQPYIHNNINDVIIIPALQAYYIFKPTSFIMNIMIIHLKYNENFKQINEVPFIDKIMSYNTMKIDDIGEELKTDGHRVIINRVGAPEALRPKQGKGRFKVEYVYDGYRKNGTHWSVERGPVHPIYLKTINDDLPYSIQFKTETEAINFINSTTTKFHKYFLYKVQISTKVPVKYVPFMNDYTEPWTDERFYKYFELTDDEINTIEETIK